MKIKCIIIDDEPSSQNVLKKFIADVDFLELITVCNNAIEGLQTLKQQPSIDLIFLDINMPKISGLTFYKSLQNSPNVIFTTAYSQYAVDGFELNAVDYLLKPFSFERFFTAVNKVLDKKIIENSTLKQSHSIIIKSNKVLHKINPDSILYIEAYGDYVKVHLEGEFILTNSTFSRVLKSLEDYKFVRTHKSFAINLNKLNSVNANQVNINDQIIPIGQKYKANFMDLFNKL